MQGTGEASDDDLIRRTAQGDREAFAALYRRHGATVYRFARLMTGCTAAADDIVQEVFLSVMRDASRYDPQRASLPTYLYGAARHLTRRRLQRELRFVAMGELRLDPVEACDPERDLEREEGIDRLRRAILTLPSRYREALVLCDLQSVSYADAATTMRCAVGTVRSRLHRARQLLSIKLQRATNQSAACTMRCAV